MSPYVTAPDIASLLERDKTLSLYIHVPFCASRCIYCDFYSTVSSDLENSIASYVDALSVQIRTIAEHFSGTITSIYFGGGTPSLLGESIAVVLREITGLMTVAPDAEITIEANPESLRADNLKSWRLAGANRISLGVQSFNDETLRTLGRAHAAETAESALALLRNQEWTFSLDLIAGIPGVSVEQWEQSVKTAIDSGASHMSIYPLAVEEDTPLETLIAHSVIEDVDEDVSADQMLFARHELMRAGFNHYEIANFAKPGCESRHNSRYWTAGSYLGLGPGAASMMYGVDPKAASFSGLSHTDRIRFVLHESLEDYLDSPTALIPSEWEDLTVLDAAREDIMLGLRLFEGVPAGVIERAGLQEKLAEVLEQGLIEISNGAYRLTEHGWLLGNEVFTAVWCDN